MDDIKLYIIVNDSLKMSVGKIISQCCHSVIDVIKTKNKFYNIWIKNNQPIIVLRANENILYDIIDTNKNVIQIYDMGLTQVKHNSLTCIALQLNDKYPDIIKKLKIY